MDNLNKKYKVIVSDRAGEMLAKHAGFVAQVSIEAAEKMREQIIEAIRSLEMLPQRCPWLTAEMVPFNKYRKLAVAKRYLIIYQIRDQVVYVDYVLDCRQDYNWLLV